MSGWIGRRIDGKRGGWMDSLVDRLTYERIDENMDTLFRNYQIEEKNNLSSELTF